VQFLKKLSDLYIFSNVHVSLAGFCLVKITMMKFGIKHSFSPIFVAFSIVVSYNFIRYYELKINKTGWTSWHMEWFVQNMRLLVLLSILSVVGLFFIVFFSDFNKLSLLMLSPFLFMTFFYAIPLMKIGERTISFRSFPFVKIFAIAISWAAVSVFFPLYEGTYEFTNDVYIEFVQRFLILVAITIPFDIRDIVVDPKLLKTLPQVIGIQGAKKLGTLLLFFVVSLELLKNDYSNNDLYVLMLVCAITGFFLWGSTSNRSRYYASFWVESIPIMWFVILVIKNIITKVPI